HGPEHLRHVVLVFQHEHVLHAEHEAHFLRQDLYVVASHAARPRALRDLEDLVAVIGFDRAQGGPEKDQRHGAQREAGPLHFLSRIATSCAMSSALLPYGTIARRLPPRSMRYTNDEWSIA